MEGTPVIAGAMDMVASALGTASIDEGEVYIAGGTVTAVGIITDSINPHPALHLHNHIIPGKYIAASGVDFGGGGLRWFRNVLQKCDYKEFDRLASQAPPGNEGLIFLPYMVGQRSPLYNNNTTGVVFGLNPNHDMKHMVRMFMEGTAYGVRNIFEYFRMAGSRPILAKMTGGLANGALWPQIMADITGIDIRIPASVDVAAMGAALTAGVAAGIFSDYKSGLMHQKSIREYKADPDNIRVYEKNFEAFKKLYECISPCYDLAKDNNISHGGTIE
jgi:xylulokinase